jgi:hypothetical protein
MIFHVVLDNLEMYVFTTQFGDAHSMKWLVQLRVDQRQSEINWLRYICHKIILYLFINNILIDGHKQLLFLTLVPQKIFFITIITKTLELAFNYFCPGYFLDLERGGMRGRSGRVRERRESGFAVLVKNNMVCFLGTLSSFQPSLGAIHEDLGSDFILEATDKSFVEKGMRHALVSKIQLLKCGDKLFHDTWLFQFGQMAQGVCVGVKSFIKIGHKLCPRNISLAWFSTPFPPFSTFKIQI